MFPQFCIMWFPRFPFLVFLCFILFSWPAFAIKKVMYTWWKISVKEIFKLLMLCCLLVWDIQSYIVYLGSHDHGPQITTADLQRATDSHHQLLSSFLGRYVCFSSATSYYIISWLFRTCLNIVVMQYWESQRSNLLFIQ